jgi:uncharacterized protein DUF4179
MSDDRIEKMIDEFNNIDVPIEIDLVCKKAVKKAKRHKRMKLCSSIAAILTIIFIISFNASPTFASYIRKILVINDTHANNIYDKGIIEAVNNGFVQEINKSVEDNDIKITYGNLIIDKERLILDLKIDYTGDSIPDLNNYCIDPIIEITNGDGKIITEYTNNTFTDHTFKNNSIKRTIDYKLSSEITSIPEKISITCTCIDLWCRTERNLQAIEGNWTIEFKPENKFKEFESKKYSMDKKIKINSFKFNIDYIKITPTVIKMKLEKLNNDDMKFTGFKKIKLKDNLGNEYLYINQNIRYRNKIINDKIIKRAVIELEFESNYFIKNSKKLYLTGDGIFCIPKDNPELIVDVENNKLLADGNTGTNFVCCKIHDDQNDSKNNEPYITLGLNIVDDEIYENIDYGDFSIFNMLDDFIDENGFTYYSCGVISCGYNKPDIEIDLYWSGLNTNYEKENSFPRHHFDKEAGYKPKILKAKINALPRGILEEFQVRVK